MLGTFGQSAHLTKCTAHRGELAEVQALGCREDMPLTIKVQGQDVMVFEEFVYLGSLIHSSTRSTCDISRRRAITRAAMHISSLPAWLMLRPG